MVVEQDPSHYDWKRLQTSEQQAQRERKSILQKALVFARRADSLMLEDMGSHIHPRDAKSLFWNMGHPSKSKHTNDQRTVCKNRNFPFLVGAHT